MLTSDQVRDLITLYINTNPLMGFQNNRMHNILLSLIDGLDNAIIGAGGEPTISAGTTAQYWRGDKSWQTLNKAAVGLNLVQNLDQTVASNLLSGSIPAGRYGALTIPITAINATGTANATTILFGDGSWGTYAYSDGDKGDVTISTGGTVITLNDDAVTLNHLPEISQFRVLGRVAAGIGDVSELSGSDITPFLDVFNSTTYGIVPPSGGGTVNFLRADGTWQPPGSGATLADGTYNDIIVSSGGTVLTIANLAVTNSMVNDVAWTKITGAPSFTVDATIINGSTNAVEGNAVYDALQLKQDTISLGTTAQYFRGDLSLATFPTISGSNTGDVTKSGETYITLTGQAITANAVNLSGTHVTGTLAAARIAGTATDGFVATLVSGVPTWQAASGGSASLTSTRIAFGDGSNLITDSSNLRWDNTNQRILLGGTDFSGNININATQPSIRLGQSAALKGTIGVSNTADALTLDSVAGDMIVRTEGGRLLFSDDAARALKITFVDESDTIAGAAPMFITNTDNATVGHGSTAFIFKNEDATNSGRIGWFNHTDDFMGEIGPNNSDGNFGLLISSPSTAFIYGWHPETGIDAPLVQMMPTGVVNHIYNSNGGSNVNVGLWDYKNNRYIFGDATNDGGYALQVHSDNGVAIKGSVPLTRYQGTGVTTGFTGYAQANVGGISGLLHPTTGGAFHLGLSVGDEPPFVLGGVVGSTSPTVAAVYIRGYKSDGSTSLVGMTGTNLIADFQGGGTTALKVYANGNTLKTASSYINWGTTSGSSGYGFRDNAGIMEWKDSGGSWATFGSGAGGESLQATMVIGNSTTIPTIYAATGTNRNVQVGNTDVADNFGILDVEPATGTDVNLLYRIMPKGNGFAQFDIYGTNRNDDGTNYELISMQADGTAYKWNVLKGGTGVLLDMDFMMNSVSMLKIAVNGSIGFNSSFGTSGQVLTSAGTGGPPTWTTVSVAPTLQDVLNNGSTLTTDEDIDVGANRLSVTGSTTGGDATFEANNTSSGAAIFAHSVTGTAIDAQTTSGTALSGAVTSGFGVFATATTGIPGVFIGNPTSTNTRSAILSLYRNSSGTAANSISGSIETNLENSDGTSRLAGIIETTWTDVVAASRTSSIKLSTMNSAVETLGITLSGNGNVTIHAGQLIVATQFTPSSSSDATHAVHTLTVDDSFLYYKTGATTWVRQAWSAF